jgi:dTDP-4-dehydrorhamnose reductase
MKIAILGGAGQVGWELQRALAPLGEIVAVGRGNDQDAHGDLENPDELRAILRALRPDLIANAAAYTDVDRAESEPERARRVNADGPALLAAEAKRLDAWLIQYSTDFVFDGSGSKPWREDDAPGPLSVYGESKRQGEEAVRGSGCRHVILRTQWIYSARRKNFVRTILRLAEQRDHLDVVDTQTGAPTGAELVADVTAHVVRSLAAEPVSGTYHVAARGETTRHGYARFIVACARDAGWPVRVADGEIAPVATDSSPARRPQNSRLDVQRLERTFGLRMPDWRVGVARVLAQMGEHRSASART